ncbi:MAG: ATP-dependent zinc metalloprotease FtsH [Planctomycetes bacterium]|nr:ATP-dependent zinc metalloprotease FtsH [Planctomycetota bacterium]
MVHKSSKGEREKAPLSQFLTDLDSGAVAEVTARSSEVEWRTREGGSVQHTAKTSPDYIKEIIKKIDGINAKHGRTGGQIVLKYDQSNELLWGFLIQIFPWILFIFIAWFFLFRQLRSPGGTGGVLSFGRSRARLANKEHTGVTLDDVAGIDEAKEDVTEIIAFLQNPTKFQRLGGRIPRGVLLVGPPGTGKTLLAKAIAGEADVPFFSVSGSDFVEMFVGVGASRVRDLFRQAKENHPCIIFLDEIDAVGRRRGSGLGGGHDEREQTLNAILVEMDGFERDEGIIMLAATNRPDVLDAALLRPGRFDREIIIDMPDLMGRQEILAVHAHKIKLASNVDLTVIARGTPGFSGADLEAIINEAAIIATMREKEAVTVEDLEEARDKVRWGRQKRSKVMDEEDKKITAYHEAGHTLIGKLIPEAEPIHKVSIIPQGRALGATMYLPEKDHYHMQKNKLLAYICASLGGRVAEEMFCDDISSGAQNDFEQATEIARHMVCKWGMSEKMGPINYIDSEEHLFIGREITRTRLHSEATAIAIDNEIKRIIDECYERVQKLMLDHKVEAERIAEALLKHETLHSGEIDQVMEGREIQRPQPAPKKPPDKQAEPEAAKEKKPHLEGEELSGGPELAKA